MTDEALLRLDAEIHAQERLLEGLKRARAICVGGGAAAAAVSSRQLLLSGPQPAPKQRGKARQTAEDFEDGKDGVMEINGVDVAVTYRHNVMLELLSERQEACATKAELTKLCGGKASVFKKALADLNIRLQPANAQVVARKAKGFMLEDIA